MKEYDKLRELMFKDRQTHIDEEGDYWAVGNMENYTGAVKGIAIDKLAEFEDKIEQKKMLELPFLVGQDAFIIEDNEIVMGVVNGIWWQDEFLIEVRYGKDKYGWRYAQRLKDGIFSTKAEAENKLEELKNENTRKQQDKN